MNTLVGIGAITALGLPLTWDVVRLGWEGVGSEHRLLSLDDVRTFADHEVVSASEAEIADVAELCTASSEADVKELLERLAPSPSVIALRIWRAVLLERLLRTPQASPIETLTELTSFWAGFGYPPESPHTIQGLGNSITPKEYYTEETAEHALQEHRRWLEDEIGRLQRESGVPVL